MGFLRWLRSLGNHQNGQHPESVATEDQPTEEVPDPTETTVDELVAQHEEQMEDINGKTSLYNDWKDELAEKRKDCAKMRSDAVSDIQDTGSRMKGKTKHMPTREAEA